MRIFVAGGTGVIGQHLIPMLAEAGHEVIATTRSPGKNSLIRGLGATPVIMDGLDSDSVLAAVSQSRPEVIIHQMTALNSVRDYRKFDKEFEATNQLRTTGTENLLAAARATGTRRFIAQSYAGWPNIREGGPVKAEEDPLDPHPPAAMTLSFQAIRHVERAVSAFPGGVVLRYGSLYGPGLSESLLGPVRKRQMPIIGSGAGVWSFCHIEDAVTATVTAVPQAAPGIYNIVDDDPAPVTDWLPFLAACLGAKPPLRIPVWLGRLAAGEAVVSMMTAIRGASNQKARREFGWSPLYPSWRDGFPGWAAASGASSALERVRDNAR